MNLPWSLANLAKSFFAQTIICRRLRQAQWVSATMLSLLGIDDTTPESKLWCFYRELHNCGFPVDRIIVGAQPGCQQNHQYRALRVLVLASTTSQSITWTPLNLKGFIYFYIYWIGMLVNTCNKKGLGPKPIWCKKRDPKEQNGRLLSERF